MATRCPVKEKETKNFSALWYWSSVKKKKNFTVMYHNINIKQNQKEEEKKEEI